MITFLLLLALVSYDFLVSVKFYRAGLIENMNKTHLVIAMIPGGCSLLYHLGGYKKLLEENQ